MRHIRREHILVTDQLAEAPSERACVDQRFELPTGIYAAMGLMFAGFVTVLSLAFSGHMTVSFGVIFAFLVAFFAVPTLFVRTAGGRRSLSWQQFLEGGIDTATGRADARSATVLVLVLPFLILCFATTVAIIAMVV